MRFKKIAAVVCGTALAVAGTLGAAACSGTGDTTNTLFFYPLNYYGIEGRSFTYRWEGMKAALADYGWTVTGDGQKDSLKFVATRTDDGIYTTPSDTQIVFVNNQTWDTGLALTDPLAEYQPLAIISTCNGVEFCSQQIASWSPDTQNATMGGFSDSYEEAFQDGTLSYLTAKYSCSVAPMVALIYNAVTTGTRLSNNDGYAINLSQDHWHITSYDEYMEAAGYDSIGDDGTNPTIMKADMDSVIPATNSSATYDDFAAFVTKTATYDGVKSIYNANRSSTDTAVTTSKITLGLLVPNSINDSVQAYIDYISGYAATAYNMTIKTYSVSGTISQDQACQQACDAGCDAIISLQDDTDRTAAIKTANNNGVFFGVAGTAIGDSEYEEVKDLDYFVGAVGASLQSDYDAAYTMTAYYLNMICERGEL